MRNSTLSILSFALIAVFLGSCSTSSDLTGNSVLKKRRYTKGYQVNIKGNNTDKKNNSVTADMESLKAKPVSAVQPNSMAQTSLSTEITEADLVPNPKTSNANESANDAKAQREITTAAVKTKIETGKKSSKHQFAKHFRSNSNALGSSMAAASGGESLVLYVILAILIPPLAVGLLYGIGTEFWISLVLTLLFYVPGLIYALIKVFQKF